MSHRPSPAQRIFESALDKALEIPASRIEERVARLRRDHPHADVTELTYLAQDRFKRDSGLSSGAVGASAAFPSITTPVSLTLSVGQLAVFLASAVTYVLTVAELHGLRVITPERRRALVLSALLGEEGAEAIQGQLGLSTLYWAAQNLAQLPLPTASSISEELMSRMGKYAARKSAALVVGRVIPFGIGAFIGWTGGRAMADRVIDGTFAALGPAGQLPAHDPRDIDGDGEADLIIDV